MKYVARKCVVDYCTEMLRLKGNADETQETGDDAPAVINPQEEAKKRRRLMAGNLAAFSFTQT